MDFIVGLPLTSRRHESIFVVVDTLTKSSHFIPMCMTYPTPNIAIVFMSEIVRLHGLPKRIIFYQGSMFTRQFWTSFQEALGTKCSFSIAYHLKIDGKTKQTKQILEEMFPMYLMDQQKHWEEFLPLVEFA
jgi:hypothetical protein